MHPKRGNIAEELLKMTGFVPFTKKMNNGKAICLVKYFEKIILILPAIGRKIYTVQKSRVHSDIGFSGIPSEWLFEQYLSKARLRRNSCYFIMNKKILFMNWKSYDRK